MSTHSITHTMTHGPTAFAAAAAVVAAVATGAFIVSQNDDATSPVQHDRLVQPAPGKHYPPLHGGTTQSDLP
jgi:hypothetical protein